MTTRLISRMSASSHSDLTTNKLVPTGGGDVADLAHHRENDAKGDQIVSDRVQDGDEYGREQDHHPHRVDVAAKHDHQDADHRQDDEGLRRDAGDRQRDILGDAAQGEDVGIARRRRPDDRQRAGRDHRRPYRFRDVAKGQFPIDEPDDDPVDDGDHRGLGGREDAEIDAAQDNHRRQQRQESAIESHEDLPHGEGLLRRYGVPRHHVRHEHHRQGEECARNHRAHEELGDRDFRQDAVGDQDDAGRNQDAEHAARCGDAGGQLLRILFVLHFRDHDRSDRRGGRRRRAGNGGEKCARKYRGDAEPASDVADNRVGEIDDAPRQAPTTHQGSGKDEQGNGDPGLRCHARIEPLREYLLRQIVDDERQQADDADGEADGNLGEHKEDKNKEKYKCT